MTERALALLAVLFLVAGCTTAQQTHDLLDDPGALPKTAMVADVPFFPQEKYFCGPAATAMTLAWSGLPVTQEEMAEQVYTPGREGTLQPDVIAAMRRNGRLAVPVDSLRELLGEIAAGRPVLVFQNLGLKIYPRWHFAVAIGYDLDDGELIMHTGPWDNRPVALRTFEHTWRRGGYWALVALKPGEMPVAAKEAEVVRAAAGLERVNRPVDAAVAYEAILERWPHSFPAWMGLGNARYAMKNLAGAEQAWRGAIAADPQNAAPAWNNLAYVLQALGHRPQAIDAAKTAVELGDPNDPNYRATLDEITNM
ncbi:MAG: PA2778 family cysteine peptidase [Proteobacteria bacterium]|nr:PA2778 family cysteine peptidase [Pseudomonadota bacterium]